MCFPPHYLNGQIENQVVDLQNELVSIQQDLLNLQALVVDRFNQLDSEIAQVACETVEGK